MVDFLKLQYKLHIALGLSFKCYCLYVVFSFTFYILSFFSIRARGPRPTATRILLLNSTATLNLETSLSQYGLRSKQIRLFLGLPRAILPLPTKCNIFTNNRWECMLATFPVYWASPTVFVALESPFTSGCAEYATASCFETNIFCEAIS